MPALEYYADSVGPGTCRSCGAAITWVELTSGRRMPLEGRDLVPLRTQSDLLGGGRTTHVVDTSVSPTHWERCPDAKEWKRR